MISTELFPYENHPYRLEFGEKKNVTVCYFSCEEHLQKYLIRHKLDKKTVKINYRDEPIQRSKKHQRGVEQKSKPKSDGSSSSVRKRKPSVDTAGDTSSTAKSKKRNK